MKVVLQYRASPGFQRRLAQSAPDWLDLKVIDERDKAAFTHAMAEAQVLLHVLEPVTRAVIDAAPQLKLIQKIGVGVNTIDLDAARAAGVAVANMPGTNTQAVAEHSLLLMLATLRRVVSFDSWTRQGLGWTAPLETLDQLGELAGRTVGLVGFGSIAQALAPVLRALGASVRYTARSPKAGWETDYRTLDALLAEADVLSLHLPLTQETEGLLNSDHLLAMRPGSILVNTARGGLVDEAALVTALTQGPLSGAGLDTFALEPLRPDNPLLSLPNVVLTPHMAWLTPETLERSMRVAIDNCRRVRAGERLLHQVA